jgi:hypothetical protein
VVAGVPQVGVEVQIPAFTRAHVPRLLRGAR